MNGKNHSSLGSKGRHAEATDDLHASMRVNDNDEGPLWRFMVHFPGDERISVVANPFLPISHLVSRIQVVHGKIFGSQTPSLQLRNTDRCLLDQDALISHHLENGGLVFVETDLSRPSFRPPPLSTVPPLHFSSPPPGPLQSPYHPHGLPPFPSPYASPWLGHQPPYWTPSAQPSFSPACSSQTPISVTSLDFRKRPASLAESPAGSPKRQRSLGASPVKEAFIQPGLEPSSPSSPSYPEVTLPLQTSTRHTIDQRIAEEEMMPEEGSASDSESESMGDDRASSSSSSSSSDEASFFTTETLAARDEAPSSADDAPSDADEPSSSAEGSQSEAESSVSDSTTNSSESEAEISSSIDKAQGVSAGQSSSDEALKSPKEVPNSSPKVPNSPKEAPKEAASLTPLVKQPLSATPTHGNSKKYASLKISELRSELTRRSQPAVGARGVLVQRLLALDGDTAPTIPAPDLTEIDLKKLSMQQLKHEISKRGIVPNGRSKAALISCLAAHLKRTQPEKATSWKANSSESEPSDLSGLSDNPDQFDQSEWSHDPKQTSASSSTFASNPSEHPIRAPKQPSRQAMSSSSTSGSSYSDSSDGIAEALALNRLRLAKTRHDLASKVAPPVPDLGRTGYDVNTSFPACPSPDYGD